MSKSSNGGQTKRARMNKEFYWECKHAINKKRKSTQVESFVKRLGISRATYNRIKATPNWPAYQKLVAESHGKKPQKSQQSSLLDVPADLKPIGDGAKKAGGGLQKLLTPEVELTPAEKVLLAEVLKVRDDLGANRATLQQVLNGYRQLYQQNEQLKRMVGSLLGRTPKKRRWFSRG